jgi:colicin import membrane protein
VPPKRSPKKDPGVWKEMVELDTQLAEVARETEKARALKVAVAMRADLDAQVAEREAQRKAEREKGARERGELLAAAEAARRAAAEASAAKAVAAAEAARKIVEFGLAEKARKEEETKKKWEAEAASIRASEELLVKAEAATLAQRAKEKEDLVNFMRSNDSVIAARKAAQAQERAAENAAARAAVAAMDAAEAKRLAELKAKEDQLKAKLAAMGDVYAKQAADERELLARLEAERVRGEKARDQLEIDREVKRKAFEESIKKEVGLQLSEKERAAAAEKAREREARRVADATAAAVKREEEAERVRKDQKARGYQAELDAQMVAKLASMSLPDETPLERTSVKTFIRETQGSLKRGKVPMTF